MELCENRDQAKVELRDAPFFRGRWRPLRIHLDNQRQSEAE